MTDSEPSPPADSPSPLPDLPNVPDKQAPPTRGRMERSVSQDIREEREDLKEAAEQSQNVILDLNLDGTIRLVSPSWQDVIGTPASDVQGKPIADLLTDNKNVFADAVESIQGDDSRSQIIRFSLPIGPLAISRRKSDKHKAVQAEDQNVEQPAEERMYEAQGIMIYDRTSGGESHVGYYIQTSIIQLLTHV